ncbi:hypothetical protein HMPREF9622_00815 [Cutibacterium modestum HL037PA3]|uniref:Uncharacterized protein n=1 Tax=Cutibacterium modestum HL044PA1 TaxID=765109 RepID=A0ABN0C3G4_9ACTN|nr:hypothetical protein HMPREF9607_02225 [Cutibacterium modestum HL044PA1]EFT15958.1 hypothetical protein HMPREF9622_00815 [Cutibacterium modestum HL037PA3]
MCSLILLRKKCFLYIISVALVSGVTNWTIIIVANPKFRQRIGLNGVLLLKFRMPGPCN